MFISKFSKLELIANSYLFIEDNPNQLLLPQGPCGVRIIPWMLVEWPCGDMMLRKLTILSPEASCTVVPLQMVLALIIGFDSH